MAAARKLQVEIDKTLKKVQEGCEVFDDIWEKLHESDNQNQKDKFESELKKEIKRLQKLRDQIKTWLQSSEVKEKKALMDGRKAVEREMERYKVAEREAKTKAFSTAGLTQAAKLDPKAKARQEARDWLNSTVDKLNTQIEELESEIELASSSKKKQKNSDVEEFELIISRHNEHIQKLEHLIRLLDNQQLESEEIEDLKEFLDDYIERSLEADPDEFEDVDYFYDCVADKLEQSEITPAVVYSSSREDKKAKEKEKTEKEKQAEEASKASSDRRTSDPPTSDAKGGDAKSVPASPPKSTTIYKKVVSSKAAAPAPLEADQRGGPQSSVAQKSQAQADASERAATPSSAVAPSDARMGAQTMASNGTARKQASKPAGPGWNYGSGLVAAMQSEQKERQPMHADRGLEGVKLQEAIAPVSAVMQQAAAYHHVEPSRAPKLRDPFLHTVHSIPHEEDRRWNSSKPGANRNKVVSTPPSYPRVQPPPLQDPTVYERFDGETLFFAFFHQANTANQMMAAKSLKKKNWRYNKKERAWFQRLKEPTIVTPEAEQGSYILVVSPGQSVIRENYVFEYANLESEVTV